MFNPVIALAAIVAIAFVAASLIDAVRGVLIARSPAGIEAERQAGISEQIHSIQTMPTSNQPLALEALKAIHGPDSDELLRRASVREIR